MSAERNTGARKPPEGPTSSLSALPGPLATNSGGRTREGAVSAAVPKQPASVAVTAPSSRSSMASDSKQQPANTVTFAATPRPDQTRARRHSLNYVNKDTLKDFSPGKVSLTTPGGTSSLHSTPDKQSTTPEGRFDSPLPRTYTIPTSPLAGTGPS